MKGDFSRNTFRPNKHYRAVLKQQGRVDVDADWNEQQAINLRRIETEAVDVIGGCGAPLHDAGFHIVSSFNDLTDAEKTLVGNQNAPAAQTGSVFISAGRFYVDGILCENEQIIRLKDQPDLPAQSALKAGTYLAYLDVWTRHINALDDPLIREKALGGPDTANRVKTVWQVKLLGLTSVADSAVRDRLLADKKKLEQKLADLLAQTGGKETADTKKLRDEIARIDAELAKLPTAASCDGKFKEWDSLVAPSTGKMNARTQPEGAEQACLLPPSAGYQRLENQLYRVEIHQDSSGKPSFVWSRDNGSVVTAVTALSGSKVVVADLGPDDVLGFAIGQWVELTDDEIELNGRRGQLLQIKDIDQPTRTITMKTVPPAVNLNAHPKLRRWDQGDGTAGSEGIPINFGWQKLEGGIEVQFSQGTYKTGDYWVIPARSATGEIEWPPFEIPNRNPIAQHSLGIAHHYCRLALLQFDGKTFKVLSDCRKIFPPLTELPTGPSAPTPVKAFHVIKTNWANDDVVDDNRVFALFREGLGISFDAAPDTASLINATMMVKIEAIIALNQGLQAEQEFFFDGKITPSSDGRTIRWTIDDPSASRLKALLGLRNRQIAARARIILKGATIWSADGDERIYLDGQAFGQAGFRSNQTPRIDLIFPTGAGAKASDFESWFDIAISDTGAPNAIVNPENVVPTPARKTARKRTRKNT